MERVASSAACSPCVGFSLTLVANLMLQLYHKQAIPPAHKGWSILAQNRMNRIGPKVVDFRELPQTVQDQMADFKKKFGITKPTAFRHWICYEDN